MFRLKSTSKRWLGVDLSSTAIKIIELSHNTMQYQVESYAILPLPQDTVVDKIIKQADALKSTLKKTLRATQAQCTRAVTAIPNTLAMTKSLSIPQTILDTDLESYVWLQASEFLPYDLTEVTIDFAKTDDLQWSGSRPNQEREVFVVATRSEEIHQRIALFNAVGLDLPIVDLESLAIERVCRLIAKTLPNAGLQQLVAIIDIGATLTQFTILDNLNVVFTREELFGGKQLTQAIQRTYNLDYASAGLAKKTLALPDNYPTDVLIPFQSLLVLHIKRTLQLFASHYPEQLVDHIVLAGGTANIAGLAEWVQDNLGIRTTILDPFANMSISNKVDQEKFAKEKTALALACGLSLRGFEAC